MQTSYHVTGDLDIVLCPFRLKPERRASVLSNFLDFIDWKVRGVGGLFTTPHLIRPQLEVNDSLREEFLELFLRVPLFAFFLRLRFRSSIFSLSLPQSSSSFLRLPLCFFLFLFLVLSHLSSSFPPTLLPFFIFYLIFRFISQDDNLVFMLELTSPPLFSGTPTRPPAHPPGRSLKGLFSSTAWEEPCCWPVGVWGLGFEKEGWGDGGGEGFRERVRISRG